MKHDPLVSVLMSVYNGMPYLPKAIESILNQSYENLELLIIDDNSSDNTKEFLNNYEDDSKIKLFFNKRNKGLPENLNFLITQAKGDFIARMDADDYCDHFRIEKQIDYLLDNDKVDMVGTFSYLINKENVVKGKREVALVTNYKRLLKKIDVTHASVIFRKNFFLRFGYYDENMKNAQDMDLWLRATKLGAVIHNIPEFLYYIRYDFDMISRRKKGQHYRIQIKRKHIKGFKFIFSIIPNLLVLMLPNFALKFILNKKYRNK